MSIIVAEIGQNHQGSVEVAKDLVELAARPIEPDTGEERPYACDAVKLTKRDLDHELSRDAAARPYAGRQSFGATYGEHRQALELTWAEHMEVAQYARSRNLAFVVTLCAPTLVDQMPFTPDALKVASRDLTHVPLLRALARTELPLILSTGMHGTDALDRALTEVTRWHDDVTILHCLSQYPADNGRLNLKTIPWLRERYPDHRIGYSDHSIGILAAPVAVALGAELVEKHVTLYRGMRGSDHRGAIGPEGLWRMVRDIRNVERMLGTYDMYADPAAEAARKKLERSLAAAVDIEAGERILEEHLDLLSPGTGIAWHERDRIVGKRAAQDIPSGVLIGSTMIAA